MGDGEHLFTGLLAISISSLVKCLFMSSAYLLTGFLFLGGWVVSVLYVLDTIPVLSMIFANIFSLWVGCLIILTFSLFFCCVETFYLAVFPIVCFCFRFLCLRRQSRKMLACSMSRSYCLPSCRMCMVSGLTLRSRNCFVCVCMVYKSSLISFFCV